MKTSWQLFDSKVYQEPNTGCWLWGGVTTLGYGRFKSRDLTGGRIALSHRISYIRHRGPIPEGLQLDHLCRNRACVNPDHLEPVTRRVNILRGISPVADNGRKTHCYRGHGLEMANLYTRPDGGRECRICRATLHMKTGEARTARRRANRETTHDSAPVIAGPCYPRCVVP